MPGVGFVTGKKYVAGNDVDFFAIGTIQSDNYIYFNDNEFYRCKPDGNGLQLYYAPFSRWVQNSNIRDINVISFDVSGIIETVGKLLGGSGSVAPDGSMESAVQWMINTANDPSHGYDQTHRTGPDYDCSSFVSAGLMAAGFDVPYMTTFTMRNILTSMGWTWLPGWGNTSDNLQRGDILLSERYHVEVYIGGGQNVGAHINEFGGIVGGQTGDQTGNEISVSGYYAYPWDGVLRKG